MQYKRFRELRGVVESARLGLLPTLATNALAAWVWASGSLPQGAEWRGWSMVVVMGICFYLYGMWENDRVDARWDARHGLDRPVPRGEVDVWTLRWLSMAAGTLALILSGIVAGDVLLGLLLIAVIIFYNWMHKAWKWPSLILMGGCRGIWAFLAASASVLQISGNSAFNDLLEQGILREDLLLYPASLAFYTMLCTWVAQGEETSSIRKKWAVFLLTGMCLHDVVWLVCLQAWNASLIAFGMYVLVLFLVKRKHRVS